MTEDTAIKTENLMFFYASGDDAPPREILKGVDLEIRRGEFVAIIGHNGSGKSTAAKHMNALLLPKGGTVRVFGLDTADEALTLEIRRQVGMVFQNPDNQIVSNVVEEDVAFAPENLGVPPEEIRRRVDEALKTVGMYDYKEHTPHLLSGGQKQRVAIAGVLAMNPKCIIFDEPTAMLDPVGRQEVLNIIDVLRKTYGTTVVLITHHMEEAVAADRIIVMSDGRVVMNGSPREIFTRVEELNTLGLAVPDTTYLLWELNKSGFDLPLDALTTDECAKTIFKSLR